MAAEEKSEVLKDSLGSSQSNEMEIHITVNLFQTDLFQSGQKWWTDSQTDISHVTNVAKNQAHPFPFRNNPDPVTPTEEKQH